MRRLTVLDWKSGKNVEDAKFTGYTEHPMQVSAYAKAYNLEAAAAGEELITAGGLVYLDKETGRPRFIDTTEGMETNFAAFCAAREYFRLKVEPHASDKRFYKYGGERFPSVTTILGILDKPALIQWAANCAVECIESVIDEIRNPKTSQARIEQLMLEAKKNFRAVSRKAMDIGTVIHNAIQTHLHGGDPTNLLDGNEAAQTGFLAFLEWAGKVKLEVLALEKPLFHPGLRYAGTPDFIGHVDLNGAAAISAEKEELDVF